jgi:SAM-dependent methyltransferase
MASMKGANVTLSQECKICGADTNDVGRVYGRFSERYYELGRCSTCGYAFVVEPWLDYANIYDEAYYAGQGADRLVDYSFELRQPDRTIRLYEWQGIARIVKDLVGELTDRRWLDYGCGNGGLVRYLRETQAAETFGFEQGAIAERARALGIPMLDERELGEQEASFDIVSAIEVMEHTVDPVGELRKIRRLLRPGGLLFLTTGNARPYAERLQKWSYVTPEIHISLFEPRTLHHAMTEAGFRPEYRSLGYGFDEILMFKVLKNLNVRRRSILTDVLPCRLVGVVADRRARLSEHPIGWAV